MNRLTKIEELGFKCSIVLSDFHFWQNLNSYVLLMEAFTDKKITGKEFEARFYRMHARDGGLNPDWEELVYIIKNYNLSDFEGITALMSDLFVNCDSFEANLALRDETDLTEEELRNYVFDNFLKIKNRYIKS